LTPQGTKTACWNPVIYQVPQGDLLLWWKVGGSPKTWWGVLKRSTDGGKTWGEPIKLGDIDKRMTGSVKNKPVKLMDGSILAPSSFENPGGKLNQWFVERSLDNGKTWQFVTNIENGEPTSVIQPTILQFADGHIQMLGRNSGQKYGDPSFMPSSTSTDYGTTWTPTEYINLPQNDSGFDNVTLRDGRQFLVYNHSIRSGSRNVGPHSGGGKGRELLNVAVSDNGKDWNAVMVLDSPAKNSGHFIYPSVIQSEDGLVHIIYTFHRAKMKYVVIDPECITETAPMPEGVWPSSGPASVVP
jgi:predicted neuraminidase